MTQLEAWIILLGLTLVSHGLPVIYLYRYSPTRSVDFPDTYRLHPKE